MKNNWKVTVKGEIIEQSRQLSWIVHKDNNFDEVENKSIEESCITGVILLNLIVH